MTCRMFAVENTRLIHSSYLGKRPHAVFYSSHYDGIIFTIRVLLLLLLKFQKYIFLDSIKIYLPLLHAEVCLFVNLLKQL